MKEATRERHDRLNGDTTDIENLKGLKRKHRASIKQEPKSKKVHSETALTAEMKNIIRNNSSENFMSNQETLEISSVSLFDSLKENGEETDAPNADDSSDTM